MRKGTVAWWTAALAAAGLALGLGAGTTRAETTEWVNPGVGDWFEPANWSAGLPTDSTDAVVDTGGTAQVGAEGAEAKDLRVGDAHTGTLTVEAGGRVASKYGYLGYYSGSEGTATVTGAGSAWTNSGDLKVGYAGTGTLNVEAGGRVASEYVTVGEIGTGTLHVKAGGQVSNFDSSLGRWFDSQGTARVTGAGSAWTISGGLGVGDYGTGRLIVEAGGRVSSGSGCLGYLRTFGVGPEQGMATVTGAGSVWTISGRLYVGYRSTGTLIVEDGGRVSSTEGYLSYTSDGQGTARVTGAGSAWTNSGDLYVSRYGIGMLTVEAGGKVLNSGDLYVGRCGTGTINVESGGQMSNGNGYLGYENSARGTATVTGAGSAWTNYGDLYVGRYYGIGTLDVRDGGQVRVANTLHVGRRGSLTLAGGTLDAWTISPDVAATTAFDAGTLRFMTYEGSLTNPGCTLGSPDFWYGLTVTGDYTQGPGATLLVEIDGLPESGQFDVLSIGGTADLAGTLALDFSLAPPAGTEYEFLRAESIGGTFDDFVVTGLAPWQWVEFDVPAGRFTVLPEPGALLALACRRR